MNDPSSHTSRTTCDIDVKILGETKADACDLASLPRPHQPLAGYRNTHANAAIGANRRVVLNHFAAIVAVHSVPSTVPSTRIHDCSPKVDLHSRYASLMWSRAFSAGGAAIFRQHGLIFFHRQIALLQQVIHFSGGQVGLLQRLGIRICASAHQFIRSCSPGIIFLAAQQFTSAPGRQFIVQVAILPFPAVLPNFPVACCGFLRVSTARSRFASSSGNK